MAIGYRAPLFLLGLDATTGAEPAATVGYRSLLPWFTGAVPGAEPAATIGFLSALAFLGVGAGVSAISPGDDVQVIIAGGIECTVFHDTGTPVRVVTQSSKQISVLTAGGTPIKVTI